MRVEGPGPAYDSAALRSAIDLAVMWTSRKRLEAGRGRPQTISKARAG